MLKRSWGVSVGVLVALALLSVYDCGHKQERAGKVKIGYLPITADLPLFVAKEKGYFREEGIDAELVKMGSSNEAMNALMAGRIDVQGAIGLSSLISIESQSPGQFKLYATGFETEEKYTAKLLVGKESGIVALKDLKGKVIGTYSGLTQLLNLKLVLKDFLDPDKDVTIRQVSTALQVPSLESGQFDALFTIDPYGTIALEKGIARVLVENPRVKHIMSPFPTFACPVSSTFLDDRPGAVQKVIRAYNRALEFIESDKTRAEKLVPEYTPLSEEIASKCGYYQMEKLGEENLVSIQSFADILLENEIIENRVDVGRMYLNH